MNKREGEQPLTGLNVLLGRLYWGMARKERWIALVANKIQAKLATIKVKNRFEIKLRYREDEDLFKACEKVIFFLYF